MKRSKRFGQFLWGLYSLTALLVVIALAGCGSTTSGGSGAGSATEVQVTLSDFKVQSSFTTFSTAQSYHFVVTNNGATEHEFMIAPPMMRGMDMGDAHDQALVMMDKIPAGATKSVDYTFTKQAPSGTLEIACYVGSHYTLGMKQTIEVKG